MKTSTKPWSGREDADPKVSLLVARFCSISLLLAFALVSPGFRAQAAEPFAFTQSARPIALSQATLNGMATPNGSLSTAWFEWGPGPQYGQATSQVEVGGGTAVVRVSAIVTNLLPGRIYHCRLVCSNDSGLRYGFDQPFAVAGRVVTSGQSNLAQPAVAANARQVVSLSTYSHNIALRNDGSVTAWGYNDFGQTNVPSTLSNAIAVAAGGVFSLALKADATVAAWGSNAPIRAVPSSVTNVIAIAAGSGHALALKGNGKVVAWGYNDYGQTNVPTGLSNVVAVAAGTWHSLALRADGTVIAWGRNNYGQINVPAGLSNAVAISGGYGHSVALKDDGTVLSWSTTTNIIASNVVAIATCENSGIALRNDDTVLIWGSSQGPSNLDHVVAVTAGTANFGALTIPKPLAFTQAPQPVRATNAVLNGAINPQGLPTDAWFEWGQDSTYGQTTGVVSLGSGFGVLPVAAPVTGLAAQGVYHCRIVASNELGVARGADQWFTTGRRVASWARCLYGPCTPPAGLGTVVAIAAGDMHGLALKPDGTVTSWGHYLYPAPTLTPPPAGLANVAAIAGGRDHSLALREDGVVFAWGDNSSGQTNVPAGLSNVVAISAGDVHSLALKQDGTLAGWGKFGPNNAYPVSIPVSLSNVVAIASGDTHWLALRDNGTVFAWGGNDAGQANVPVDLTDVVAIAGGWQFSLALKANGNVVEWGNSTAPFGLSNVVAIASGDTAWVALKNNGSVATYGSSTYGSLTPPVGLSNVLAVAVGDEHCLALAPNVPPQTSSLSVTGAVNVDCLLTLKYSDANGDLVTYRISALPTSGSLFQFEPDGRGPAITAANTPVTDSLGRVLFAPELDDQGLPYTTFNFLASDGEADSSEATFTVSILPRPLLATSAAATATNGPFSLNFTGISNAAYSVWASTNLSNWSRLGSAAQPTPGQFFYNDITTATKPKQFYRVTSP